MKVKEIGQADQCVPKKKKLGQEDEYQVVFVLLSAWKMFPSLTSRAVKGSHMRPRRKIGH